MLFLQLIAVIYTVRHKAVLMTRGLLIIPDSNKPTRRCKN